MGAWAHEFEGSPGQAPDPSVWVAELGGGGWGDDQLQSYTRPPQNAFLTGDGQLAIVARPDGAVPGGVTSARLTTKGRVAFRYGRISARIKVPAGAGVWPAFWMLGMDIDAVGWPACGEIDVMEHVGSDPTAVHGTLHGPGYAGVEDGQGHRHRASSRLAEGFHVYAVEWRPERVTWLLDGTEYFMLKPEDVPGRWPFDHHFYLVLNLAIGGRWPGNEVVSSSLPATMLIDGIRVTDSDVALTPPPPNE